MPESPNHRTTEPPVELYDTTLRDGSQGEGISFSIADKLRILRRLDDLGVHYIEGGWPGSNPKDIAFFREARDIPLRKAKLAAFGCTCRKGMPAAEDPILQQLIEAETPVVTIFGKSWTLHVEQVLRATRDENLRMIRDSVAYFAQNGRELVYDAEHFFDGYKDDPGYALATLEAAKAGGASIVVLCDTNGGSLPSEVARITADVIERLGMRVGIHTHNDCELGVANSIAALQAGACHVQGTMNGYGERTGNANLTSIIPVVRLKLGRPCLSEAELSRLTETALFVAEVANMPPGDQQPFVGRSAFAHKAGMHVDAVHKNPRTFEHIDPALVGNERRILVSELSGGASIALKAQERGLDIRKGTPEARRVLDTITQREHEGYHYEGAEASLELLMRRATGEHVRLFDLLGFRVIVERRGVDRDPITEATLKVAVNGVEHLTVAEGDGPVHALDGALRKALEPFYPEIKRIRLTDFKVRVVNVKEGTAAKVRVLVESADDHSTWSTIGVSTNVIEASWLAIVDSIEYALLRSRTPDPVSDRPLTTVS
jgi:2-isopropylmalate synthase